MTNQPTLSPRTLGMYYGCAVIDTLNDQLIEDPKHIYAHIKRNLIDCFKLVLKRAPASMFHSPLRRYTFEGIRDGYDMGGLYISR